MKIIFIQILFFLILNEIFSFPYETYSTIKSKIINESSNPLSQNCQCDKIKDSCDPYCCCDTKCRSPFLIAAGTIVWEYFGQCKSQPLSQYEKLFKNCIDPTKLAVKDDLFSPIRVFYQNIRRGFCMVYNNGQGFNSTISSNFTVTNSTEFTDLVKQFKNVTNPNEKTFLFNSTTFNNNIPYNYQNNFLIQNYSGYFPNDPLMILNSNKYETFSIPIINAYGTCINNLDSIRYIRNKNFVCSYKMNLNSENCLNFNKNNFNFDLEKSLLSYNSTINTTILIKPKYTIKKVIDKLYYNMMTDIKLTQNGFNIFSSLNNECTCTNMITGINIEFQMLNETVTGYSINYQVEDVKDECNRKMNIPVNYKINFMSENSEVNYERSGNPGYLKGKALISGQENFYQVFNNISGLNDTIKYVDQFSQPRLLYGVGQVNQNRGLCYHNIPLTGIDESLVPYSQINLVTETVTNSDNTTSTNTFEQSLLITPSVSTLLPFLNMTKLESSNNLYGIFHNPILDNSVTYEDKISWGCVDKLNMTGLKYYCTNQLWKQKMLFNIIKNLTFISQFGNPNRHFTLDWINVEPFSLDSYQSIWDETYHKCTIPAVLNVDILYATYGAVNNTQHGIFKVQYRMDYIYWWGKNIIDRNIKNNFFSYVNINYFRIPQETVWWFAPGPGFIKLPRNIMYPFRVGTTFYGVQNSGIFLNLNLYFLLFFVFLLFC